VPAGPAERRYELADSPCLPLCHLSATRMSRLTIRGQRISRRSQTVEIITPILICPKLPPEVIIGLVLRILEIVFPIRARLPDIHDCARDALFRGEVGDLAVHECDLSVVWVLDDAAAEVAEGGVGGPEGSEDGGGGWVAGGFSHVFVCDFIDESAMDGLVSNSGGW
jgi:hypothetical protein